MRLFHVALLCFTLTGCISEGTAPDEPTSDEEKSADLRAQCETLGQIITAPDSTFTVTCGPDDL